MLFEADDWYFGYRLVLYDCLCESFIAAEFLKFGKHV